MSTDNISNANNTKNSSSSNSINNSTVTVIKGETLEGAVQGGAKTVKKTVRTDFSECITDAQRTQFNLNTFINRHIRTGSKAQKYEIWEIHCLLERAGKVFQNGKALVEVRAPVNICGDTHGQYSDLLRIFNSCGAPTRQKYLFLGDYIDRGRHSLEVICLLMALRLALPKRMFLLRGNHELRAINKNYGFYAELQNRFRSSGGEHVALYDHFNYVFSFMPLAGIVSKRILCMHGGISPHLKSLDDIRNIELPLETAKQNPLACDLLWADPEKGCAGFENNKIRAISHIFGESEVDNMCKRLDIDLIVRAHQVVEYGYAFFADRRLVTVFSASRYQEELHNYAAVVVVSASLELSFIQLKPEEFEKRREENDKNGGGNENEQPTAKGGQE
ncbi:unnamed protein product [Caenorhabditis angaria]|uniref:Serine/threonine-protein phosphatase n=1 Tax=Caenorhabditis angaria TaxID=860376 RepID=A0A9P1I6L6_9PELO|nr:unnamed protein product [Caenorhabditis angaria]